MDNIGVFNEQVTLVAAKLISTHPRPINLHPADAIKSQSNIASDPSDDELGAASGTILWLKRNGFLAGDLQQSGQISVLLNAQLTSKFYARLSVKPNQLSGGTVGEFAAQVSNGEGPLKADNCAFVVSILISE